MCLINANSNLVWVAITNWGKLRKSTIRFKQKQIIYNEVKEIYVLGT